MPDAVKVELSREVYEELRELAERRKISVQAALQEALGSGLFILRETANGSKILIRRRDGSPLEELIPA